MLKIRRAANGEVVFMLSGRMDAGSIAELETLFRSEADGCRIALDLKDLTLVNQEAVSFLEQCETGSITLKNCPAYIREWITRRKSTLTSPVRRRRKNSGPAKRITDKKKE